MTNTNQKSRRKFTAEFKAMVAMEALQERQTLSELCKKHNLHPNQISSWKRQLKENSVSVFKEILYWPQIKPSIMDTEIWTAVLT